MTIQTIKPGPKRTATSTGKPTNVNVITKVHPATHQH